MISATDRAGSTTLQSVSEQTTASHDFDASGRASETPWTTRSELVAPRPALAALSLA